MPVVHLLDAEDAHKFGIFMCKYRFFPTNKYNNPPSLVSSFTYFIMNAQLNASLLQKTTLCGLDLENPIGIAAGFDKNGEAILGLEDLGFGFIEIGSVTPEPQFGNDKPRVFRLREDQAVINRYGFNNDGHDKVLQRVIEVNNTNFRGKIGINLGKNKHSISPIDDYVIGIKRFGNRADYLVINISSPNTPGLRDLQHKHYLKMLLNAVVETRNLLENKPPLFVKLAPDLTFSELSDIADVILSKQCKIDGVIISNTTIERPETLDSINKNEIGGLSGQPLRLKSTEMIRNMYKLTKGRIPIIGVGGIFSGQDAYEKIKAGASVVQIYTSLIYEGPPVVTKIKKELSELLIKDGFESVAEAVGRDNK